MSEGQSGGEAGRQAIISTELERVFAGIPSIPNKKGFPARRVEGMIGDFEANISEIVMPSGNRFVNCGKVSQDLDHPGFVSFNYAERENDLKTTRYNPPARHLEVDTSRFSSLRGAARAVRGRIASGIEVDELRLKQERDMGLDVNGPDDWQEFIGGLQTFVPNEPGEALIEDRAA